MVFVKKGLLSMLVMKLKLTRIKSCTHVVCSLTYKKALDTVNHSILLRKLNHYGVRGIINDWFASYLVGRQQTTQMGPKNISKKEVVLSGVPQGSVLGPILFLIYVNDISNSSDKLKFYLFADDSNLLYADKNLKSLESTVNAEIFRVYN